MTVTDRAAVAAAPPQRMGVGRTLALTLLCVANFMVILDSQIVILALPSMSAELGLTPDTAQWVVSANLLAFGGLLLLGGRAADLLGRRRVFIAGTALFLVVSVVCGLAGNVELLVGARVLHGVSAALMTPTALSLLASTFAEGRERNIALGAWSGIAGIGATAGLLAGGVLTGTLGWRWVFFVNVPVAALMLLVTPLLLDGSRARVRPRTYDVTGALVSTVALTALVFTIAQAPANGWWSLPTLALTALTALLVAAFVAVERRAVDPLLPLGLLRVGSLAGGNLVTVTIGALAFGLSVAVSQYAQVVLGHSPLQFGLEQAVMPFLAFVGAYAGAAVVTRIGVRPVVAACLVLMGAGCLLLARVPVDGDYARDVLWGLVVFGPGLGAGGAAAAVAALGGVSERDSGVASGLNTAALQIGGALGVAVVSIVSVSVTGAATTPEAATAGIQAALAACSVFAGVGLVITVTMIAGRRRPLAAPRR